jgi:hypothetical protein
MYTELSRARGVRSPTLQRRHYTPHYTTTRQTHKLLGGHDVNR